MIYSANGTRGFRLIAWLFAALMLKLFA